VIDYIFPHDDLKLLIDDFYVEGDDKMKKVNALKYLVEINQASGGTSRDKPIPKLLLSMGEQFLKEKREWVL